jgi:hypothetical protein
MKTPSPRLVAAMAALLACGVAGCTKEASVSAAPPPSQPDAGAKARAALQSGEWAQKEWLCEDRNENQGMALKIPKVGGTLTWTDKTNLGGREFVQNGSATVTSFTPGSSEVPKSDSYGRSLPGETVWYVDIRTDSTNYKELEAFRIKTDGSAVQIPRPESGGFNAPWRCR